MSGRRFLDTNVLVYAIDKDEPVKQRIAQELLREPTDGSFVLSTQVLAEFYVTATRKLSRPLSEADAEAAVGRLAHLPVVSVDRFVVMDAIKTSRRHQLSLWDALIIRSAEIGGCDRVSTEDLADGAEIHGIRIENPFR